LVFRFVFVPERRGNVRIYAKILRFSQKRLSVTAPLTPMDESWTPMDDSLAPLEEIMVFPDKILASRRSWWVSIEGFLVPLTLSSAHLTHPMAPLKQLLVRLKLPVVPQKGWLKLLPSFYVRNKVRTYLYYNS